MAESFYQGIELQERVALLAFELGYATADNMNELSECRNMLALGSHRVMDEETHRLAFEALAVIRDIRERAKNTGVWSVCYEELSILKHMVEMSALFWAGHPGKLFLECYEALRSV